MPDTPTTPPEAPPEAPPGDPPVAPDDRPIIVGLKPTQRDPSRIMVRVGKPGRKGRVMATLGQRQLAPLDLEVGQVWTEALAERVAAAAVFDKALRQAMNRLGRRAMSRSEITQKLRQLGYEPLVRQQVVDRLDELSLLDDEAYARALVRETQRAKPAGPMLLKQKLRQKGIDRNLADRLADQATEDKDEQADQAVELLEKKLRSMERLEPVVRKRRLYGLLARRGFTPDTIGRAMERVRDQINAT